MATKVCAVWPLAYPIFCWPKTGLPSQKFLEPLLDGNGNERFVVFKDEDEDSSVTIAVYLARPSLYVFNG